MQALSPFERPFCLFVWIPDRNRWILRRDYGGGKDTLWPGQCPHHLKNWLDSEDGKNVTLQSGIKESLKPLEDHILEEEKPG
jgi:hypothetical protein